jgi:hypothetical protein
MKLHNIKYLTTTKLYNFLNFLSTSLEKRVYSLNILSYEFLSLIYSNLKIMKLHNIKHFTTIKLYNFLNFLSTSLEKR